MSSDSHEPIEIVGIDTSRVGTPRNDGTAGSALYAVPIKLSRTPSREWADSFPEAWNHPPQFTTMHRPGIARVSGDSIILDGTTVEEVRDYHAKTLSLVVARLNEAEERYRAEQAAKRQRETQQRAKHEQNVRQVADETQFE